MRPQELADRLRERFPDLQLARNEVTVIVPAADVLPTMRLLRDDPDLSLRFLSQVNCTDWPGREPRFWVVYHLYSMEANHRLRVKVGLPADEPRVPSVTGLFPTANFQEREVLDMFGVVFDGHPDPRRILMPDEWEGHPARKDYGLGGVNVQYKGAFIPPPDQRTY
jgi:NADH-quinone oxidoreductase subunit C